MAKETSKRPSRQDLIPSADQAEVLNESLHSAIANQYPETPSNRGTPAISTVWVASELQQRKRAKLAVKTRGSLHKPFRSPMMRAREIGTGNPPAKSGDSSPGPSKTASVATSSPDHLFTAAPTPGSPTVHEQHGAPPSSLKPRSELVATRRRVPFRSPVTLGSAPSLGSSAHSRLVERQGLESRIAQLKSSIRKGKLVLRSQESEDAPLGELVEKWKRVSQAGAQVLLEKYIEQEQILGTGASWDNDDTGSRVSLTSNWGYHYDDGFGDDRGSHNKELDPQDRRCAEEERMELEDVQYDLPTVEEALRSRCLPESRLAPKPVTKMQRLLGSLGIDLGTIGYNPDNDSFSP
ncbi:hypothetical protein EMPS_03354 [Entomortierella parvispora]|uniref:Swi5-dependent recombination DNA repair protein 1 n=1 Tax=Entomortierella parvispora TaxID=205924 RepID=A0A9P3LUJ8_9FUNG|nr:hypothetical protein EMPS_03354 [Entomortierella parvispora]